MVTNSVSDAKQRADKKCTINDVELVYKGVHDVYTINEDGEILELKETYGDESYFGYYYCESCGEDWSGTAFQDREQAFKLVKEHLTKEG